MRKHILTFSIVVMMAVSYGCATTSTMTATDSTEINMQDIPILNRAVPVAINVAAMNDDYAAEENLLRSQLIFKLKENGHLVSNSTTDAPQKVNVKIIHLKRVGGGARFLLGPLAGSAEVNVTVDISTTLKSGRFKLDTKAVDWSGFAGTTEQTVAKVVDTIVLILQGRQPD